VRPHSYDFCELAQWVAVPEWEAGGLAPVMQTFVGPLDAFDRSTLHREATGLSGVFWTEH